MVLCEQVPEIEKLEPFLRQDFELENVVEHFVDLASVSWHLNVDTRYMDDDDQSIDHAPNVLQGSCEYKVEGEVQNDVASHGVVAQATCLDKTSALVAIQHLGLNGVLENVFGNVSELSSLALVDVESLLGQKLIWLLNSDDYCIPRVSHRYLESILEIELNRKLVLLKL